MFLEVSHTYLKNRKKILGLRNMQEMLENYVFYLYLHTIFHQETLLIVVKPLFPLIHDLGMSGHTIFKIRLEYHLTNLVN